MSSITQSDRSLGNFWIAVRRPLLTVVMLGCAMSLMTSGRLTLRLAVPAAIYWSFVPLLEIAGLAVVCGRQLSARLIDRFFQDQWPWLLWVTLFAALWGLVPPGIVIGRTLYPLPWYGFALAAAAWSAKLDYVFSMRVLGRTRSRAMRDVAVQRIVAWPAAVAIFVWPAAWQLVAAGATA
jgi:hypothetical protein